MGRQWYSYGFARAHTHTHTRRRDGAVPTHAKRERTYPTCVKVLVLTHWPWRAVKSSTRRNSCAPSAESMASVMVVRGPYVAMPEAASSRPVMPVRREPGQMPKMVPTAKFVSMMEEPS